MTPFDAASILGIDGDVTPDITKKAYRDASKKYHPDRNPAGEEMMKVINQAYEVLQDYEGKFDDRETDYSDRLNDAFNSIIGIPYIFVEICGSWVWVTGDTKPHKETLKDAGFKWASKKKAWFFRPEEFRSRSRGDKTLDEIRAKYGSTNPNKSTSNKTLKGYNL